MAAWSDTTKHLPSSINSGNQYTVNDQVAVEALNNTVENAFYAVRVAENAEAATNNGVSYDAQTPTGTEQEQAKANLGLNYSYFKNGAKSFVDASSCSTYQAIYELAVANKGQLSAGIGTLDGNTNLKTLLGNPEGFGNYTRVLSTKLIPLGNNESNIYLVELTAFGMYIGKIAKGYIWYDHTNYNWTGWFNESDMAAKDASNLSNTNKSSWKTALNVAQLETIYDKSSNDSSINWGYTNGINSGTTITDKDFNPYSYLIITVGDNRTDGNARWTTVAILDLTSTKRGSSGYYTSGITAAVDTTSNFYKIVASFNVNSEKTSIVVRYTGINNAGDGFAQAAGDNMSILKIVGVK